MGPTDKARTNPRASPFKIASIIVKLKMIHIKVSAAQCTNNQTQVKV